MVGLSGKYRLDARLGGGGMAEVFIGSTVGAEGFSRKVAIKRVLPGYSDNAGFASMFVAEAQISSQLVHPNIVSVLDFDRDAENRLFLVMELVEGKDLDGLMATGILPFPVVIAVISEVLRGLGYAHDLPVGTDMRGIIHRDVSPHNVLLSWEGAVKVSDFGIAKARAASEATASVFIKGKPAYMSPEQANGQALDGRSDLFAVGVMLWELLVGRRLFTGEDTRATLAAVLFGQIPRPRSVRADVPKDLDRITMKLLERDLAQRYATAEEANADLLQCGEAPKAGRDVIKAALAERFPTEVPVRHSHLRTRGPTAPTIVGPQQSIAGAMAAPTATMLPPRRSRTGLAIALAVVGMVGLGALTFALVSRKHAATAASDAAIDTRRDSPHPIDGTPDVPPNVAPPDATPDATPDAAPPDAAPPDAPLAVPDAAKPRPIEKRTGHLHVEGFPVLTVYVDGHQVGYSAYDGDFPIGKHTVRLSNTEKETFYEKTVVITIVEGKTTKLAR